MTEKEFVLDTLKSLGVTGARELRTAAKDMTGTEIIAREGYAPDFDPQKDYSDFPVGAPVADEGQVWTLITPHNAAHYDYEHPSEQRALWALCHTTDPKRAKPWVDAYGTSGMYMLGECYRDGDTVYRAKQNNLVHDAVALPSAWEIVE